MKLDHLLYEKLSGRILLVVLAILLTLCVEPTNAASEPGTVTVVLYSEPRNIDSLDSKGTGTGPVVMRTIFEPLVDRDPDDGRIIARLATSWKQIDANTWHFFLRKGVKFHDGEDFNAQAVVFNINRLNDKRIISLAKGVFSDLKIEGKALDSHTLELKMNKVEPLLLTFMGFLTMCSPNTPVDKMTRNPIGTGPYKFVRWDAGVQIILERFDGYWGKQPQVQKAVYLWRSESAVRAAMILNGEADLAMHISRHEANRPDMDYSYFTTETFPLRIGGEWEPPLNDRRVRMALNYAVDRDAIRGSILSKDVIPATQMVSPHIFGYNPDIRVWPYDPKRARQLLDEARKDGVPVDKEIALVTRGSYFPGADELMEAVMTMYKAVGFNVKLKIIDYGVSMSYRYKPYTTKDGPYLMLLMHDNNFGDAVFSAPRLYGCKGDSSTFCDKEVDDLMEKARGASGEERRNLWRAVFKRAHEEIVPFVMLFHQVAYCRVGKRINFKPSVSTNYEIPLAQITFK